MIDTQFKRSVSKKKEKKKKKKNRLGRPAENCSRLNDARVSSRRKRETDTKRKYRDRERKKKEREESREIKRKIWKKNVQAKLRRTGSNSSRVSLAVSFADSNVRRGSAKINRQTGESRSRRRTHREEKKRNIPPPSPLHVGVDLSVAPIFSSRARRAISRVSRGDLCREIRETDVERLPRSCRELSRSSQRACDACCCIVEEEEEHRSSIFVPRDGAGGSSRSLRACARLARKSRERKQEGSGGADRNTLAIERSLDGMSLVLPWLEQNPGYRWRLAKKRFFVGQGLPFVMHTDDFDGKKN